MTLKQWYDVIGNLLQENPEIADMECYFPAICPTYISVRVSSKLIIMFENLSNCLPLERIVWRIPT
jgi:fructose-1,6-bisphosphatase